MTQAEWEAFQNVALSVAIPVTLHDQLLSHLLQTPRQEDLAFALWFPSIGAERSSALLHTAVLPEIGDRQQHGNVSFNAVYLERVLDLAVKADAGIAFLHSHLGPGWQDMSPDDIAAEVRMAGIVTNVTGLPLLGLTAGTDGAWSARMWFHRGGRRYESRWCETVRVIGPRMRVSFYDSIVPRPLFREEFKRTRAVWGEEGHAQLARLRVGIIGLGSVGMAVAEGLARSGVERLSLIDFDEVQRHNADRLQGSDNQHDVGQLKVNVASRLILRSATASHVAIRKYPFSVVEKEGYRAALDCDVLFSCVDRPRARQILNQIAYAHLIPVIDGGVAVRFRDSKFVGAEWQAQTASVGQACLECLNMFTRDDADTERAGMLEYPSYMRGISEDHHLKRNENVYPFSMNLASMELMQFIGLAANVPRIHPFGVQRMHLVAGMLEGDTERSCTTNCDIGDFVARGDRDFCLIGVDHAAVQARQRQSGS